MRKIPKIAAKRVFSLVFLDPSSPRLASGSPGPPNNFMVKKPTRLGELIASTLSFSSPGRATFAPSAHFPINRHAREAEEGFQHSALRDFERNKGEEEEISENEVEALPNHDCNQPLHHSSFSVLLSSSS